MRIQLKRNVTVYNYMCIYTASIKCFPGVDLDLCNPENSFGDWSKLRFFFRSTLIEVDRTRVVLQLKNGKRKRRGLTFASVDKLFWRQDNGFPLTRVH